MGYRAILIRASQKSPELELPALFLTARDSFLKASANTAMYTEGEISFC